MNEKSRNFINNLITAKEKGYASIDTLKYVIPADDNVGNLYLQAQYSEDNISHSIYEYIVPAAIKYLRENNISSVVKLVDGYRDFNICATSTVAGIIRAKQAEHQKIVSEVMNFSPRSSSEKFLYDSFVGSPRVDYQEEIELAENRFGEDDAQYLSSLAKNDAPSEE